MHHKTMADTAAARLPVSRATTALITLRRYNEVIMLVSIVMAGLDRLDPAIHETCAGRCRYRRSVDHRETPGFTASVRRKRDPGAMMTTVSVLGVEGSPASARAASASSSLAVRRRASQMAGSPARSRIPIPRRKLPWLVGTGHLSSSRQFMGQ